MVKHRGFTQRKFLNAVGEELLREYFADRDTDVPASLRFEGELFQQFLDGLSEEERQAILEDFECINDIAERAKDHLEDAKRLFQIETPADEPRERTAMRLFLQDRDGAFAYAYDSYLYRLVARRLQHFQLPPQPAHFTAELVQRFRAAIQQFYEEQAKGAGCLVKHRREGDTEVLLLLRGDHITTELVWERNAPQIDFFRKAKEEVLIYNPHNAVLSLKVVGRNELAKRKYIEAFYQCFLGLPQVDEQVFSETTVSLAPIQLGRFSYTGNPQIVWVKLVGVLLRFQGVSRTTLDLRSDDVMETLRSDLKDISLRDGTLQLARLRFKLNTDGSSRKPLVVELHANGHTDLPKKREADIIEQYLTDNGVLLGGRATSVPVATA